MVTKHFMLAALVAAMIAGSSQAAAIYEQTFESGGWDLSAGEAVRPASGTGAMSEWTLLTGSSKPETSATKFAASTRYLFVNGGQEFADGPPVLMRTNTIGTIDAGLDYTLTVGVGNSVGTDYVNTMPTAFLRLLADGVVVAETLVNNADVPDGTFADFSTILDGALYAGQSLAVELASSNEAAYGGSGGLQGMLDDVRITAVPEPMTLALLGVAGLLVTRRRVR
jgi:opacity protein-like surface antigen